MFEQPRVHFKGHQVSNDMSNGIASPKANGRKMKWNLPLIFVTDGHVAWMCKTPFHREKSVNPCSLAASTRQLCPALLDKGR